jgi:hypothetical protein
VPDGEHRAGRGPHDALRDAADEQVLEPRAPVRAHDDERDLLLVDDRLISSTGLPTRMNGVAVTPSLPSRATMSCRWVSAALTA